MMDPITLVNIKALKKVCVVRLLPVEEEKLRKLTAFGILPGVEIRILQVYPIYVLEIGHTQLAVDYEIAKNIMVTNG
jgi:DtxR family Mn-dependent transcriptional regulator/ferrous iron transport protein A